MTIRKLLNYEKLIKLHTYDMWNFIETINIAMKLGHATRGQNLVEDKNLRSSYFTFSTKLILMDKLNQPIYFLFYDFNRLGFQNKT